MRRAWFRSLAPVALLLVGSCGSSGPATSPTSPTTSTSAATTATTPSAGTSAGTTATTAGTSATTAATAPTSAATTAATTAPATTVTTPTTTSGTPTTVASDCPAGASTDDRLDRWPGWLSGVVGVDVRVGRHACFERFVIEFGGTGDLPGWAVRYVPLPVTRSPSDLPIDLPGTAALQVTVGAWMPSMEGVGYGGPTSLDVAGFVAFRAIVQTENFEGVTAWTIGLDRVRPFAVTTLANPLRLVVDVVTGTPVDPGTETTPTSVATAACEPFGATGRAGTDGPIVWSLTGREVRVGRHDCYERLVLELRGDGPFPSWWVAETDEPWRPQEGATVPGNAHLTVWIAAGNTVPAPDTPLGYTWAWTIPTFPDYAGFTALLGARWGSFGDEKDSSTLVVGLDRVRPFRVTVLTNPPRLVIDVATSTLVGAN